MNFNEYDYIIPIGSNCRIGEALNSLGYRKNSYPLDWVLSTTLSVYKAFDDEFIDYFNSDYCTLETEQFEHKSFSYLFNKKYRINITHETEMTTDIIDKYARRVNRLIDILNSNSKILLIRNVLDCDVLDEVHVRYLEKENDLDPNCNDIEWLYKLHDKLNQKYEQLNCDLLLIHYGENIDKRDGVFYKKMKELKQPVNWDYFICMEALKSTNLDE